MELLPFEGSRTPSSSILTLNIVNWLTGGAELSASLQSGSAIRLEGGSKWVIRTPHRNTETIEVPPDETAFFSAEQPGAYYLTGFSYGETKTEKQRKVFTVNTQFPEESATFARNEILVPNSVAHEERIGSHADPLWGFLIAAVLALLLAEYLWFLSRGAVEAQND
jgi:hypothetical protein